jgi:hypothetical protein
MREPEWALRGECKEKFRDGTRTKEAAEAVRSSESFEKGKSSVVVFGESFQRVRPLRRTIKPSIKLKKVVERPVTSFIQNSARRTDNHQR